MSDHVATRVVGYRFEFTVRGGQRESHIAHAAIVEALYARGLGSPLDMVDAAVDADGETVEFCEACSSERVTVHDVEGIPLCAECAAECVGDPATGEGDG